MLSITAVVLASCQFLFARSGGTRLRRYVAHSIIDLSTTAGSSGADAPDTSP
jgi:hypothetical protein